MARRSKENGNKAIRDFIEKPFKSALCSYVKQKQPMNPFYDNLRDEDCLSFLNHLCKGGLGGRVFDDQHESFVMSVLQLLQDVRDGDERAADRLRVGAAALNKLLVIMDERELQEEWKQILNEPSL